MDAVCQHAHLTGPPSEECNTKNVRWKSNVGVEYGVVLDMAPPTPTMEGWTEGPWPEEMCIALKMDCSSLLSPFGSGFLTFSLCMYTLR